MTKLLTVAATLAVALVACTTVSCTRVYAQEPGAVLLVASERLQGWYRGSVILAVPYRGGHAGIVLNRPTAVGMREIFPDCAPCSQVHDPVYIGGPMASDTVLALTFATAAPEGRSVGMGPGVWLALDRETIDGLIEAPTGSRRFFAGHVMWRPGELAGELEQGLFHVARFDRARVVPPDTSNLHEELLPPAAKGLTAS